MIIGLLDPVVFVLLVELVLLVPLVEFFPAETIIWVGFLHGVKLND